jgi:hypothetical protein
MAEPYRTFPKSISKFLLLFRKNFEENGLSILTALLLPACFYPSAETSEPAASDTPVNSIP